MIRMQRKEKDKTEKKRKKGNIIVINIRHCSHTVHTLFTHCSHTVHTLFTHFNTITTFHNANVSSFHKGNYNA